METIDSKTTEPLWLEKSDVSGRRALRVDKRCDVCIVGAGITGVSLAYMLVKQGKSVILLDDGPIGAGDTCRTTAHICSQFDKPYHSLIELHGKRNAELALQSQVLAMHLIEELIAEQRIECDFKRVPAYLIPSPGQGTAELRKELKACQAIGLVSARLIDSIDLPFKQPRPAILFSNQARFNPVKYLNALLRAVERMGGRVYGNTHVDSVSDDSPASVHLSTNCLIQADQVVLATHTPVLQDFSMHTKQFAYRTYVVSQRLTTDGIMPDSLIWDMEDPYHYVRVEEAPDGCGMLLITGGEDHRTGQSYDADERYERLQSWSKNLMPDVGILYSRWSGQIYQTVDGLPYIGRNTDRSDNIFFATGFAGCGMTMGTLSASLISDLILENDNPFSDLYNPGRITPRAFPGYLQENFNSLRHYNHSAGEKKIDLDSDSVQIEIGDGAVISTDRGPLAIAGDEVKLSVCSAVCPHLNAIVTWNKDQGSFDCPAHGSRFDRKGKVINGPANDDLTIVKLFDGGNDSEQTQSAVANRRIDSKSRKPKIA